MIFKSSGFGHLLHFGVQLIILFVYIEYYILSTEFVTIMQKQFTQQCDYKRKKLKLQGTHFSKTRKLAMLQQKKEIFTKTG